LLERGDDPMNQKTIYASKGQLGRITVSMVAITAVVIIIVVLAVVWLAAKKPTTATLDVKTPKYGVKASVETKNDEEKGKTSPPASTKEDEKGTEQSIDIRKSTGVVRGGEIKATGDVIIGGEKTTGK